LKGLPITKKRSAEEWNKKKATEDPDKRVCLVEKERPGKPTPTAKPVGVHRYH